MYRNKSTIDKVLFIGICNSQDYVPADFFWSFIAMRAECQMMICRSQHPWDVIRNNRLIRDFLGSGADYFVKMDIDQVYPPNYLSLMLPLVEKYKVVGPLLYDRWEAGKFQPLVFENYRINCKHEPVDINDLSGVVEILYPHTNLFYHREVLEKIPSPWYVAEMDDEGLNKSNHIDFSFIDKIHQAGYKTYINFDVTVEHLALVRANKKTHEAMNIAHG